MSASLPASVTRRALRFLRPYLFWLCMGQIVMLAAVVLGMIFPLVIGGVFDTIVDQAALRQLGVLIAVLTGVFALEAAANFGKQYILAVVGENVVRDIRVTVYSWIQQLSLGFFERTGVGDIVSRMTNDIALIQGTLTGGVTNLLQQVVSLVLGLAVLFYLDTALTLVLLGVIPLIVWVTRRMGQSIKRISNRVQAKIGEVTRFLEQTLSGISIIQAFRLERYVTDVFRQESDAVLHLSLQGVRVRAGIGAVIGFLNDSAILVVMGYGGIRVLTGALTPGELVAFILYISRITGPLSSLAGVYAEAQRALGAAERVFEFLDTVPEPADPLHPTVPAQLQGGIEFSQVHFSYTTGESVLRALSFSAAPGETIALVGPSGSGKSTIGKLLFRFYDVTAGEILLDGINIHELTLACLRSHIAVVPQEPYLFDISMRDNIACGKLDATDAEIEAAARAAYAHSFIMKLEHGYETVAGERGGKLSGGQKQRIAIARAILADPAVLVLDEATSALDARSEHMVQQALQQLTASRTTIIIAHRLSTVQQADRILVIDQGTVVQSGTHSELLAEAGLYANLYRHNGLTADQPVDDTGRERFV